MPLAGELRLLSYRRRQAHPHITISAEVLKDGRVRIEQIKGKQNRPPVERYHADVLALLNHLQTDDTAPDDALTIQLVRRPDTLRRGDQPAWCRVNDLTTESEHLWLLNTSPHLLTPAHLDTPLMQWLIAARHDKVPNVLFVRMPRTPALRETLQLAQVGL